MNYDTHLVYLDPAGRNWKPIENDPEGWPPQPGDVWAAGGNAYVAFKYSTSERLIIRLATGGTATQETLGPLPQELLLAQNPVLRFRL